MRPEWLGCACCPPNLARLLASVDRYIYTVKEDLCLVNLYISSAADLSLGGGTVRITQTTKYPANGVICLHVNAGDDHPVDLGLRIPAWSDTFEAAMDGTVCAVEAGEDGGAFENGYFYLRNLKGEHNIVLKLCVKPRLWRADVRVKADAGKAALVRGPVVYCLEEVDNGKNLHLLSIDPDGEFKEEKEQGELGDIIRITARGKRVKETEGNGRLYYPAAEPLAQEDVLLHFIPYYTWANRGSNEMTVWVRV